MMGRWSFKEQRRLLEMAVSAASLEELVKRTGRSPESVRKIALQLGISFKPSMERARPNRSPQGLKAKGK
jgi:hypothetical protein